MQSGPCLVFLDPLDPVGAEATRAVCLISLNQLQLHCGSSHDAADGLDGFRVLLTEKRDTINLQQDISSLQELAKIKCAVNECYIKEFFQNEITIGYCKICIETFKHIKEEIKGFIKLRCGGVG